MKKEQLERVTDRRRTSRIQAVAAAVAWKIFLIVCLSCAVCGRLQLSVLRKLDRKEKQYLGVRFVLNVFFYGRVRYGRDLYSNPNYGPAQTTNCKVIKWFTFILGGYNAGLNRYIFTIYVQVLRICFHLGFNGDLSRLRCSCFCS